MTGSKSIRIVHQADSNSAEFQAARKALSDAERVIFLGFSFGRTNVDRLNLDNISGQSHVLCSCYGMTESEIDHLITQPFMTTRHGAPSFIAKPEQDCLAVLRSWVNQFAERYA